MSVIRSGFFLQVETKNNAKGSDGWISATLELSGQPNKLHLIVRTKEEIYESIDEEDKKLLFDLSTYKRCLKSYNHHGNISSNNVRKHEPQYQIVLQKRRLRKGEHLKIGFNEKDSQNLFYSLIRQTVKTISRHLSKNRLPNFKKTSVNGNEKRHRSTEDINDIANLLTDNIVYETHGGNEFKVRIVPTALSDRLDLTGIYMMEATESELRLLDFITLVEVNVWPFKSVRSFGFNEGRLYLLTGSNCEGGRGLLILKSEKCENLMNRMLTMMRSIANLESEPPTTATASDQSLCEIQKPVSVPRLAPPTPTKKSLQDLSASLQDFCRTHCCTFKPLKSQPTSNNGDKEDAEEESEDCLTKDVEAANMLSGTDEDNLSLDELHMANASLYSLDADLAKRLSLSKEVEMNAKKRSNKKDADIEATQETNGLKGDLQEIVVYTCNAKPPLPPISHVSSASVMNPPSVSTLPQMETKTHSLTDAPLIAGERTIERDSSSLTNRGAREEERHTFSTREVQLLKWRDLPGKEDCYAQRFFPNTEGETAVASEEPEYRGSDIVNFVVDQQCLAATDLVAESLSMQENDHAGGTSSRTSSGSQRHNQPDDVLRPGMIASTAF